MCVAAVEQEDVDLFESEFWALWPQRKGAKQLARERFHGLSAAEQERCLAAVRHFARAFREGLVASQYQPRAENFIGGSKRYYQEWVEGVPAYCTPLPRPPVAERSTGLDTSLVTLQAVYHSFPEEDRP